MSNNDESIILSILEQVDAEDLIEKIGYHTEKSRKLGKSLKTPCMVHKDATFASLIIDIEKKTYKCMKSGCAAFDGGNLIDLYGHYTKKSGNAAALQLANFMGLSIDDSATEELLEHAVERASKAVKSEDWGQLRDACGQIESIRPDYPLFAYYQALVYENSGSEFSDEMKIAKWEGAFDSFLSQQNYEKAKEVLENHLLAKEPKSRFYLNKKVELAHLSKDSKTEYETLFEIIELEENPEVQVELFQKIPWKYLSQDVEQTLQFAKVCEKLSDNSKAINIYQKILDDDIEPTVALKCYFYLLLNSESLDDVLGDFIDYINEHDVIENGCQVLIDICEKDLADNNPDQAVLPLRRLLELQPAGVGSWEVAVKVYEALGDHESKVHGYLTLMSLHLENGNIDYPFEETLDHCFEYLQDNIDQLSQATSIAYQISDKVRGRDFFYNTLKLLQNQDDNKALASWISQGLEWNPTDHNLERQYISLLKQEGELEEWKKQCLQYIKKSDEKNITSSNEILEELHEEFPDDLEIQILWIKAHSIDEESTDKLSTRTLDLLRICQSKKDLESATAILMMIVNSKAEIEAIRTIYSKIVLDALLADLDVAPEQLRLALRSTSPPPEVLLAAVFSDVMESEADQKNLIIRAGQRSLEEYNIECIKALYEIVDQAPNKSIEFLLLKADLSENINEGEWRNNLKALADHYLVDNNQQQAEKYLNLLIESDPENVDYLIQLADFYRDSKETEKSIEIYIRLADVHEEKGDYEKASELLRKCQDVSPDNIFVVRKLAESQLHSEHKEQGLETLKKVADLLETDNQIPDAMETWLKIHKLDSKNEQAKKEILRLANEYSLVNKSNVDSILNILEQELSSLTPCMRIRLIELCSVITKEIPKFCFSELEKDIVSYKDSFDTDQIEQFANKLSDQNEDDLAWKFFVALSEDDNISSRKLEKILRVAEAQNRQDKTKDIKFRLVENYNESGNSEKALEILEPEYKTDPGNFELANFLVVIYKKQNKGSQAIEVLDTSISESFKQNNLEIAASLLTRKEKFLSNKPEEWEEIGKQYLQCGASENADRAYAKASNFYENNSNLELASEMIDARLSIDPANIDLYFHKSDIEQKLGNFEVAIKQMNDLLDYSPDKEQKFKALSKIVELSPKNVTARHRLAEVCSEQSRSTQALEQFRFIAQHYFKEKNWKKFEDAIEEALKLAPTDISLHELKIKSSIENDSIHDELERIYELINQLADFNKANEAERILSIIKDHVDPNDENYLRCVSRLEDGEAGKSRSFDAKMKLAKKLQAEGRVREAILEIKSSLSSCTDPVPLKFELAKLYSLSGEFEDARNEYLSLITILTDRGNIEQARKIISPLLALDAENIHLREQIATLFLKQGIPEIACNQYLEIARILRSDRKISDAIRWTQTAIETTPRNIDARILLAELYHDQNDTSTATTHFVKAAELLIDTGAFIRATEILEKLCRLIPDSPEPREQLVRIYEQNNNVPKQLEHLEKLEKLYAINGNDSERIANQHKMLALKPDDTRLRGLHISAIKKNGSDEEIFQQLMVLAKQLVKQKDWTGVSATYHDALQHTKNRIQVYQELLKQLEGKADEKILIEEKLRYCEELIRNDQISDAQMIINQLSTSASDIMEYHLACAALYEATEQKQQAVLSLERARSLIKPTAAFRQKKNLLTRLIHLDSSNLTARRQLIRLYQENSKLDEASNAQLDLAKYYENQKLDDLAIAEYKALTRYRPDDLSVWDSMNTCQSRLTKQTWTKEELFHYGNLLVEAARYHDALTIFSHIIRADKKDVKARQAYCRAFLKISREALLVEEYLIIADLLVAQGKNDDALFYYDKVNSLDPNFKEAQLKATQTQRRKRGRSTDDFVVHDMNGPRPHEKPEFKLDETSQTAISASKRSASDFLAQELDSMDEEEERNELLQLIENYKQILSINGSNANVKVKLAELYIRINNHDSAIEVLRSAAEVYLNKGELSPCIDCCEKVLSLQPTDQKSRLLLKQAINKRDAFKALESAIIFADQTDDED